MAARQVARKALGLGAQHVSPVKSVEHGKATLFFREVCRALPWIRHTYKLEELTTVPQLRRVVNQMFRQNADVKDQEVVDLLIYKGREELQLIIMQHKQRHHLIDKYVRLPTSVEPNAKDLEVSPFLKQFYLAN